MLRFRPMTADDIDRAVEITGDAKIRLKKSGVSQWQRGSYPDRKTFESDVEKGIGYVVDDDGDVAAVCAVTFTDELCYRTLTQGSWSLPDDICYATIHRSAVAEEKLGRHISTFLFHAVKELALQREVHSIRIDTHPDNLVMQKALLKAGFVKCNAFFLLDGDEVGDLRYGYELLF